MFEQSGTFKNAFLKQGIDAYDYDIKNMFNETDFVVDLFNEIDKAYLRKESLFDNIKSDDLIFAFYPCTYFSDQGLRHLACTAYQYRNYTIEQKCEKALRRHNELNIFYEKLNKLVIVTQRLNIPIIIENPYNISRLHYLTNFWCLKPTIIDLDRRINGDYFKKPTQYWFLGIKPKNNIINEQLKPVEQLPSIQFINNSNNGLGLDRQTVRSLIHPQYAERFIKRYIL